MARAALLLPARDTAETCDDRKRQEPGSMNEQTIEKEPPVA
jgi:hypothetical protein